MSPAERAAKVHELLATTASGMLCTWSERMEGFPYGSISPFALDASGSPFFFLSGLAVHTRNLLANPKASLLVTEVAGGLEGGRVNLFGEVTPVQEEAEVADLRARYLARHPESAQWIDFGDFSFFRMDVANIYWVGGFGAMGWVPVDAYRSAG